MLSNAGMDNIKGDIDLCFAQVSAPINTLLRLGVLLFGAPFKKITHEKQTALTY